MLNRLSKQIFVKGVDNVRGGTLSRNGDRFGDPYVHADWPSPDLVPLTRLTLRNLSRVESSGGLARAINRLAGLIARRLRDNSVTGSRDHVHCHYDLGNDFFRLFLDARHLMYSCGFYQSATDTLEMAQERSEERRVGKECRS